MSLVDSGGNEVFTPCINIYKCDGLTKLMRGWPVRTTKMYRFSPETHRKMKVYFDF